MVSTAERSPSYEDVLRDLGRSVGLDRMGMCDASVLDRARAEIKRRRDLGLSDTMQFTFRNPDRSTDPARALAEAQSLIVGARRYGHDVPDANDGSGPSVEVRARVAQFAQADHYSALRQSLEAIAERLRADGHRAAVFVDENNLVDREVAWKAGLGWFGKSANLLLPGGGSWYVLGSVVTTAVLQPAERRVPDGCGTCRVCLDACPTQAIVADGVIDARRCLAWLVQKGGIFPFEFRVALGDRIYGCDDCQDTCPPNVRFLSRHQPPARHELAQQDFGGESLTGQHNDSSWASGVDVFTFLDQDDETLLETFGRWYIAERDPKWLRRNALIILGNVAPLPVSERVRRTIERYLAHDDAFLRAHAVWASARLGMSHVRTALANDESPDVRAEVLRWFEVSDRTMASGSNP